MTHEAYMQEALLEAKKAFDRVEVPIGAIIVFRDEIIGRGYNRRNTDKNPLAHGEIFAIHEAALHLGDWRLEECTLYITLEPCPMCAGAIVQARIPRVVIGTPNYKSGSAGTLVNLLQVDQFNHQVVTIFGVLEDECKELIQAFFKDLRKNRKKN